ncbi:MAG: hypothetical protein H0U52_12520 [Chloroflexi bacterium]|nr:hypothetical protein [Chloroflexota bacterium]
MTIYLDPSALTHSDAADRLAHLIEAGHELVVVSTATPAPGDTIPWASRAATLPDDLPRGSWFVTADPATCGGHQAGLRTMLIGPRPGQQRPTRCDHTARDLRDAVLEILTVDAMG